MQSIAVNFLMAAKILKRKGNSLTNESFGSGLVECIYTGVYKSD
jgi:hypothetical protein